jgi:hypothetical protein
MKEKLAKIRSAVEKLNESSAMHDVADHHSEIVFDILEALEPIAEHLEGCNDAFDIDAWAEELRQMVAELDD